MSNNASEDESQEGHNSGQGNDNAKDDVPEIRFAFLSPPAALAEKRSQVENDANQGDEYQEDRHERDIVANGYVASMHRPFTSIAISFGRLEVSVKDASADIFSPVIRYDG